MDMVKTNSFNTQRLTLRLMTNEEWTKFIDHVFEADECVAACKRLNEICAILKTEKICNVDVENRAQIAQFCGYIISNLYFSNIRCDEDLIKWLDSCSLNK